MDRFLDLCVSSLRRGHANLLCIVPNFVNVFGFPLGQSRALISCIYTTYHIAAHSMGTRVSLHRCRFEGVSNSFKVLLNCIAFWVMLVHHTDSRQALRARTLSQVRSRVLLSAVCTLVLRSMTAGISYIYLYAVVTVQAL